MQNSVPAVFMFQDSHAVRTVVIESEPFFVGQDVAEALGYKRANEAITQHCKGTVKHRIPTTSGIQEMLVIPERDLYRLIMRSKLPSAERFEEWVVSEVLPSIRKTGSYTTAPINSEPVVNSIAFQETLKALQKQYPFLKEDHPYASATLNNNINTYVAGACAQGKPSSIALTEAVNLFAPEYAIKYDIKLAPASVPTVTIHPPHVPTFPPAPTTTPSVNLQDNTAIADLLLVERSREHLRLIYGYYLSQDELSKIINVPDSHVGHILLERGMIRHGDYGYEVTDKGKPYALHIDVGGYWPNRKARRIIKWHSSVIPILAAENSELCMKTRPRKHKIILEEKPLSVSAQTAVDALVNRLQYCEYESDQKDLANEICALVCQSTRTGRYLQVGY